MSAVSFRTLTFLALSTSLLALPGFATAQRLRNGAVLDIEGRRASARAARSAVVEGADGMLALVSVRDMRASARAQHVRLETLSGVRDVADALDIEVVLGGRVDGRGRRASLSLYALDRRGTELGTREVTPATRAAVRMAAQSLVEEAIAVLDAQRAEERARRDRRRATEVVSRAERDSEEETTARSRPALIDADVGLGLATRNASIALASGGERRYDGGLHPELALRGEMRPFRSAGNALRGIALGLEAATAVAARSWSAEDEAQEIDTTAWRISVSAGYLFAAGPVEIGPTVAWGIDVFELGANQVMPSSSYQHARFGGSAAITLLDGALSIRASAGWRFVLSAGDIVEAFGDRASASGYDVSAGAVVRPVGGLRLGLDLGMTRYALGFDGSGEGANATEGSDQRMRATLFAGWSLP